MNFEELISYLSEQFDIDLTVDQFDSCSIQIDGKYTVQLEMDSNNHRMIILAFIATIDPGKFRENVFLNALKANHLPFRIGSFGFLNETSELTFHHFFPSENLKGEVIAAYITEMIYVSSRWREAIDNGKPGPDSEIKNSTNPFGLKP